MRITNKIIQNNSLNNINNNKKLQDMLSTQAATSKKISRPSDDPIIALRSLRLRTSVNQTDQYLNKNVEDAESWLTVTEDAIDTLSDIITDIKKQYVKGTSDQLSVSDRRIIAENLQSLAAEIYNTGNADFAGRSVFTGYRTESTLTFQKQEDVNYSITEEFSLDAIDTNYTYTVGKEATNEVDVEVKNVNRMRLSYDTCDDTTPLQLTFSDGVTTTAITVTTKHLSGPMDTDITNIPADEAVYYPETGEIFLSDGAVSAIEAVAGATITVTYDKTDWNKGDLRPEHYFKCTDNTNGINYNHDSSPEGEICYNIGVNQSLRINTTASECFTHDIMRDVTDTLRLIKDVENIEKRIKDLKAQYAATPETDTTTLHDLQKQIDAAKKAETFIDEKLHQMFSSCIANSDMYLDRNNVALTNCGTRSKRLELIQNRLDTQYETLKELKSDNEDADIAETAIKLSSAQYAYDASLMATGQIIKKSLLDYV